MNAVWNGPKGRLWQRRACVRQNLQDDGVVAVKVLVFSDSHRRTAEMFFAIETETPQAVLHLGDNTGDADEIRLAYPELAVYNVAGNNDFSFTAPDQQVIELERMRMFLCHGHTMNVRRSADGVYGSALRAGCAAALYGHTHTPDLHVKNGITIINPGSISLPRNGRPSYVRMEIFAGHCQNQLVYL